MKNFVLGLAIAIGSIPLPMFADEISLTQAVETAWNTSPLFKSQLDQQKTLLKLSHSDQWRRFLPNEPIVTFANNDNAASHVFGVNENFGFPGKAFAYSKLDQARLTVRLSDYEATRYDIARGVVEAYLDAAGSMALVDQQKRTIADTEALVQSLQARYQAGITTQSEVLIAEIQLRQQKADLAALEDKTFSAKNLFRKLLSLDDQTNIAANLPNDLDEQLIDQIGHITADEIRASANIRLADANARTASWGQAPDINFGVVKNHYLIASASPIEATKTTSYNVGMTVPVFLPAVEKAEAQRQRTQAVADRLNAEIQLINAKETRAAGYRDYLRSKNRLQELEDKDLPYAGALTDTTFAAYKSGKVGIAEVMLAKKTLTDLQTQDIELRVTVIRSHLQCLGSPSKQS